MRRVNPLAEKEIVKILTGKRPRAFVGKDSTSPAVAALVEAAEQRSTERYLELADLGLRPRRLALHTSNKAQIVFSIPLTFFGDRFGLFSEIPSRAQIAAAAAAPAGDGATWVIASQVGKGIVTSALVRLDLTTSDGTDPALTLRIIVDDIDLINLALGVIVAAQAVSNGPILQWVKFDPTMRRNIAVVTANTKFSRNMEVRLVAGAVTSFALTSAALVGIEMREARP